MKKFLTNLKRSYFLLFLPVLIIEPVFSSPVPGDIFREYKWTGPYVNGSKWQRITGSGATHPGALEFLPNPTNSIQISDLSMAIKAEITVELLQSHVGTSNKRIRINNNSWISIPEGAKIPGVQPECYLSMRYPTVSVPLSQLKTGSNSFSFTVDNQTCFSFGWPQSIFYGVIFRIYYSNAKPHPTGSITSPSGGTAITDYPKITASASSPNSSIKQVDFIGNHIGYNYEGDNVYRQWHYTYSVGNIKNHLGTATGSPFQITWATDWIPDQDSAFSLTARIVDNNGIIYMAPAVKGIQLMRPSHSIKMYPAFKVPMGWQTRQGVTDTCQIAIADDITKATQAKLYVHSWSGGYADEVGINKVKLAGSLGPTYDLSFDILNVPLNALKYGINVGYTYAATQQHGIEVLWPGMVVFARYPFGTTAHQARAKNDLGNQTNFMVKNRAGEIRFVYELSNVSRADLIIFNLKGQPVKQIVQGVQSSGRHQVAWTGRDPRGRSVSTGIYFYRLSQSNRILASGSFLLGF